MTEHSPSGQERVLWGGCPQQSPATAALAWASAACMLCVPSAKKCSRAGVFMLVILFGSAVANGWLLNPVWNLLGFGPGFSL